MAERKIQCTRKYLCKTCGGTDAAGTLTVELGEGGIAEIGFEEDDAPCADCGCVIEDDDWTDDYAAVDDYGQLVEFTLTYEDLQSGMKRMKLDKETEQAIIDLLRSIAIPT